MARLNDHTILGRSLKPTTSSTEVNACSIAAVATLMFCPNSALASGGDAIGWMWAHLVLLAALVIALSRATLPWSHRALLLLAYACLASLGILLTNDLPFQSNKLVIALATLGLPAGGTLVLWKSLAAK